MVNKMLIKNKKGLAIAQTFMFIVVALTFALIMIFGYKAISDFLRQGEQVQFFSFKTNLENSVKGIYTQFGSVRFEEFYLPAKYQQICFVNLDKEPTEEELAALCSKDIYACDMWEDAWEEGFVMAATHEAYDTIQGWEAVGENVFLKPKDEKTVPIKVYKISFPKDGNGQEVGFICPDIYQGVISLILEGKGDRTEITENVEYVE